MKMLTLVIEFGPQRQKFDLTHPIDIRVLANRIKSAFSLDDPDECLYLVQIFDEQVNEYLDLSSTSFISQTKNLFRGQIIDRQQSNNQIPCFQSHMPGKVSKQQVVGLMTLESLQHSLEKWAQLLHTMQFEIAKDLQTVTSTINTVKSHYQLIDESSPVSHSPVISDNQTPLRTTPTLSIERQSSSISSAPVAQQQQQYRTNRRPVSTSRGAMNRESGVYYPPSQVPSRPVESNIPVTIMYQRFPNGVDFEGELAKFYNPSYFFLRISNQMDSYDEMHREINLHYNSVDTPKTYLPKPADFCAVKSDKDSNWYRARVIRLMGNDKAQVIFIDDGDIAEVSSSFIRPLIGKFSDRPAQALACSLAEVLPMTQNDKCGWNRRACMSLANALTSERSTTNKSPVKVTVAQSNQAKWPLMLVHISTSNISNLAKHMSDLYLSRSASSGEIAQFWSMKIRPEQYVLFNLSSLINQKQYFFVEIDRQMTFDEIIDLVLNDPEFSSRQ